MPKYTVTEMTPSGLLSLLDARGWVVASRYRDLPRILYIRRSAGIYDRFWVMKEDHSDADCAVRIPWLGISVDPRLALRVVPYYWFNQHNYCFSFTPCCRKAAERMKTCL